MNLEDYIKETGISVAKFAKRVKVCPATIHSILSDCRDIRLSIALKIELETKGKVKCKDLLPMEFLHKKYKRVIKKVKKVEVDDEKEA